MYTVEMDNLGASNVKMHPSKIHLVRPRLCNFPFLAVAFKVAEMMEHLQGDRMT